MGSRVAFWRSAPLGQERGWAPRAAPTPAEHATEDVGEVAELAEDRWVETGAADGLEETADAGVHFLGRIRTPWTEPSDCPKRGDPEHGQSQPYEGDRESNGEQVEVEQHFPGSVDDVHPEDVQEVETGVPAEVADLAEVAQFRSGFVIHGVTPGLQYRVSLGFSRAVQRDDGKQQQERPWAHR